MANNAFYLASVYAETSKFDHPKESLNLRIALDGTERVYEYEKYILTSDTWVINQKFKCTSNAELSFAKMLNGVSDGAAYVKNILCENTSDITSVRNIITNDLTLQLNYKIVENIDFAPTIFKLKNLEVIDAGSYDSYYHSFSLSTYSNGQMQDISNRDFLLAKSGFNDGDIFAINDSIGVTCAEAINLHLKVWVDMSRSIVTFKSVLPCNKIEGDGISNFILLDSATSALGGDGIEYRLNWAINCIEEQKPVFQDPLSTTIKQCKSSSVTLNAVDLNERWVKYSNFNNGGNNWINASNDFSSSGIINIQTDNT
ncbi:MAG: hypothetical protein O3C05_02200, partial [Proteobacteria bacterium]|nr:hypothetical protein [Pseudomonadota bacterium]